MADAEEPILRPNPDRFCLFPIQYQDLYEAYQTAQSCYWTSSEVDLGEDLKHWVKMSPGEQHFIKNVLAFFAASDGIVAENLCQNFSMEVQVPEARAFYAFQQAIEMVHGEVYSQLIDHYVSDTAEKKKLFGAIHTIPSVQKKSAWALKWIDSERPFAERLVAFALIEGIFFSGSFCAIFWLKQKALLPGLTFSNELISRDEGQHCKFAVLLHSHLNKKCSQEVGMQMIREAVDIEAEFVCESLPVGLLGMNADLMKQYIEFIADYWSATLGWPKIYNATNPFTWMEQISLQGKTNFFEKRVGDYAKPGIVGNKEAISNFKFSIEDDF